MSQSKIKVSIIEDSEIHREWLKAELLDDLRFDVLSVDNLGRKGIESIKIYNPDIVLLDFQLEDMTGLEISRRIKSYKKDIKIFFITAHTEASIIERLVNEPNADAIAVKGSRYFQDNFLTAIFETVAGGTYIDPMLLAKLRESKKSNAISDLTKREFEVFIQSSTGKNDIKIAGDLCVELAHIKNTKSKIAKKIKHSSDMSNLLLLLSQNCVR